MKTKKLVRILSLWMAMFMLFGSGNAFAIKGEWDGFVDLLADASSDECDVVDFNDVSAIIASKAVPSGENTKGASYSAYWGNHVGTPSLDFKNVASDWLGYDCLELWIYSDEITNADFSVVVYCESTQVTGDSYLQQIISIDWQGWKKITLGLGTMSSVRTPRLDRVKMLTFASNGWGCTPNEKSSLYIASIKLKNLQNGSLDILYEANDIEAVTNVLSDATAFYVGNTEILHNGEFAPLSGSYPDAAVIDDGGVIMAPASVFDEYFGMNVALNGSDYTVSDGNHTLKIRENSNVYQLDGETGELEAMPQKSGSLIYIPLRQCSELLGLCTVRNKNFLAVSKNEEINLLKTESGVNVYNEIASYMTAYTYENPADVTKEDMTAIKDKWRYELVGDENNDMSDAEIAHKIKSIETQGRAMWSKMIKDENSDELFLDMDTQATIDMTKTYGQLYPMALAYGTYGSELYQNEELLNDIIYGLEFMYQNRYGRDEIENKGWRNTSDFNWFDWQIGSPRYFIPILLIIEDKLTQTQIENYLALFDSLVVTPNGEGSNKLNVGKLMIGSALLKNDAEKVMSVRDALDDVFLYVDNGRNGGEGFYTDGSYVFHSHHPLTGAYGVEQIINVGPVISMLSGTKLAVKTPQVHNFVDWIYEGFEPLLYNGAIMRMVRGRAPTQFHNIGVTVVQAMLSSMDFLNDADKARFASIIKAQVLGEKTLSYYNILSLADILRLKKIMNDDSILPRENYITNKIYHNMDKAVHQRGDYAVGISMSSSRIFPWESINGENLTGWYISDGMVSVYNDDINQYDTTYWANVDPYRLPGTTVDTQERKAVSIYDPWISSKDFAGGVSDGEYGIAAMELESYNLPEDTGRDMGSGGGLAPKHDCSLTAKKSWFMFDDELVALGSAVNANDDAEVLTIVENRMANPENTVLLSGQDNVKYDVVSVEASQVPEEANIPENTTDGILSTKWAANGEATITYDLGEVKTVGFAGVAFMFGSLRQAIFDIDVSEDKENWTTLFSGQSSGKSDSPEAYDLKNSRARYVRLKVNGTNVGTWTSLTEVAIYAPNADGRVKLSDAKYLGTEKVTAEGSDGNGALVSLSENEQSISGRWLHLENSGGYFFPDGGIIKARKTTGSTSFFELWFSHGTNPVNDKYAYVQLPNKTPEETKAYSHNPDIEILQNTSDLHAVREKNLGITSLVFWKAGQYGGIKVSHPMIVMIKENGSDYEITVSDPTHKLTEATVQISGMLNNVTSDSRIRVSTGSDTTLRINFEGSDGASLGVYGVRPD